MSLSHLSDETGDSLSWEEIYKIHSPILFGYLVRKVGYDLAGDIMQESFLRLMQVIEKKRRIDNVKAYLFQIARNLLKKEFSGNYFTDSADLPVNTEDQNYNIEADLFKKELSSLLESAKQTLSPLEREIFDLRWNLNFTQTEIAEVLSRSERQIRRDLEKIAQKIREVFRNAGWNARDLDKGR